MEDYQGLFIKIGDDSWNLVIRFYEVLINEYAAALNCKDRDAAEKTINFLETELGFNQDDADNLKESSAPISHILLNALKRQTINGEGTMWSLNESYNRLNEIYQEGILCRAGSISKELEEEIKHSKRLMDILADNEEFGGYFSFENL